MNKHMSCKGFLLGIMMVFVSGAGLAFASTIEGTVQGLQCVTSGKLCPVDYQDPHIAVERNFVVQTAKGGYFLVPNLDRSVLARNLSKKVRITGTVSDKYRSITADQVDVYANGKWMKTWSKADEREALDKILSGGQR